MNIKKPCSQCGEEHALGYAWYTTPRQGGSYLCKACAGYQPLNRGTRVPRQKAHDEIVRGTPKAPTGTGKFRESILWGDRN